MAARYETILVEKNDGITTVNFEIRAASSRARSPDPFATSFSVSIQSCRSSRSRRSSRA